MQQNSRSTLQQHSHCHTYAAALTLLHCFTAPTQQQHWCHSSHALTLGQPHSCNSTHAALMQHLSSSTHTAALMLQNSHSSVVSQLSQSHTAAFMQPHAPCSIFGPSIHGTALMLQHSQSQIFTAAWALPHLRCSSRAGALQVDEDHLERTFQCWTRSQLALPGRSPSRKVGGACYISQKYGCVMAE